MKTIQLRPLSRLRSLLRPLAMIVGGAIVVALLAWIGRGSTPSALASPAADGDAATFEAMHETSTDAEPSIEPAKVDDASVASDAPSDVSDAARAALDQLADGAIIVDLNLANEEELRKLPGIGPTRARAIIDLRRRLGRLRGVDDLARIKGLGRAMIRKLRPLTIASKP